MKLQEAKNALYRIGKMSPRIFGVLTSKRGDTTVGEMWAKALHNCEAHYVNEVIDEYTDCVKPIPEISDNLIYDIRTEAMDRRARDLAKFQQHEKYLQKRPTKANEQVRKDSWYKMARRLLVDRDQDNPESERKYQLRMDEHFAYVRGKGERPTWYDEMESKE